MRKATQGRQVTQRPIIKVLGYLVTASKIDDKGKKTNNSFVQFVGLQNPKYKHDRKISTRQNKHLRWKAWDDANYNAVKKAFEIKNEQKFPCVVITKKQNSNILIRNW